MSSEPVTQAASIQPKKNNFLEWHSAAARKAETDPEYDLLAASAMSAYRDIEAAVAIGLSLLPHDKLTISHTLEIARFINQIQVESTMEEDEEEDEEKDNTAVRPNAPAHFNTR